MWRFKAKVNSLIEEKVSFELIRKKYKQFEQEVSMDFSLKSAPFSFILAP